jgi:hypothetical protein
MAEGQTPGGHLWGSWSPECASLAAASLLTRRTQIPITFRTGPTVEEVSSGEQAKCERAKCEQAECELSTRVDARIEVAAARLAARAGLRAQLAARRKVGLAKRAANKIRRLDGA